MKSNAYRAELVVGWLYTPTHAYWVYSDIWRAVNQEWAASVGQIFRHSRNKIGQDGEMLFEPGTPCILLGIELDHFKILAGEKVWCLNSSALLEPLKEEI